MKARLRSHDIPISRRTLCIGGLAASLPLSGNRPASDGAIDEAAFITLGGVDQWVTIRGDDRSNPVLLLVHGGPGDVLWPYADKFTTWQRFFTVVLWDQRGAGRSYGHSGGDKTPDVRLARIAKDGIALAEELGAKLRKRKIMILGHSWGSVVGVEMAKQRPDMFAAYVGTGQVASWAGQVNFQFDRLLARARTAGDTAKIKELEAIGRPDPTNTAQYFHFNRTYRAAMAPSDQAWLESLRPLFQSHRGDKDFDDVEKGMIFSGRSLLPDQVAEDLPTTARRIDTAFFVIQGAEDMVTPTQLAVDYFNQVKAPRKGLALIPSTGHFAFLTDPQAFLSALVSKVRPIAISREA